MSLSNYIADKGTQAEQAYPFQEFRYERGRQPLPRIDPWRDQFDGLLLANEGKPARERLTLIRIFEERRGLGYEGSYDAVRRYAKILGRVLTEIDLVRHLGARSLIERKARLAVLLSPPSRRRS